MSQVKVEQGEKEGERLILSQRGIWHYLKITIGQIPRSSETDNPTNKKKQRWQ
jgi:hypothetical protein